MKAKSFSWVAYAGLAGALLWQWGAFVYRRLNGYSDIPVGRALVSIYFVVGYVIVFAGTGKYRDPDVVGWPAWRCYGLIAWSLATVHLDAFIPQFGRGLGEQQMLACVVVDLVFLGRLWYGRARGQKGWQWQVWAMLYLWLPAITRAYLFR